MQGNISQRQWNGHSEVALFAAFHPQFHIHVGSPAMWRHDFGCGDGFVCYITTHSQNMSISVRVVSSATNPSTH